MIRSDGLGRLLVV